MCGTIHVDTSVKIIVRTIVARDEVECFDEVFLGWRAQTDSQVNIELKPDLHLSVFEDSNSVAASFRADVRLVEPSLL
jgi:hypothetical protein